MTVEELRIRRLRAILSGAAVLCAMVALYAFVWDGPALPDLVVLIGRVGLTGCGVGLVSLQGKGLLSPYKSRLSAGEHDELDRINKRAWPGFFGMIAALGLMVIAHSLHDHLTAYYRPVILVLVAITALLAAGQLSLKRAERRLYDRVLTQDAA